jgi:TM2 domain-containing membrane protein YozV
MPKCRYCHKEISALLDKDVCPYCGIKNPIEDNYKTKDMTAFVDPVTGNYKLYKSKSKRLTGLLCLTLGYFGVHNFYLRFFKKALLDIAITLVAVGGIGSLLFFLTPLGVWGYLIPFFAVWLGFVGLSVYFYKKDSLKDGNGEFLR